MTTPTTGPSLRLAPTPHTLDRDVDATHVRVFNEGSNDDPVWTIDAADANGNHTSACWNIDPATGQYVTTRGRSLQLLDDFVRDVVPHLAGNKTIKAYITRSGHDPAYPWQVLVDRVDYGIRRTDLDSIAYTDAATFTAAIAWAAAAVSKPCLQSAA